MKNKKIEIRPRTEAQRHRGHRGIFLITAICLLFTFGCENIFEQPKLEQPFTGVALNFDLARTLTPSGFESGVIPADYHLVLTFTDAAAVHAAVTVTIEKDGIPPSTVELVPGTWNLTVYGYADATAAEGGTANALVFYSQNGIVVAADAAPTPVTVTLEAVIANITQDGTGTLSYDITLPSTATGGTLKLFAENDPATELVAYTKPLTAGRNTGDIDEIDSGFYYVVAFAELPGGNMAFWRELAQICDGMVTVATVGAGDFSTGTGVPRITAFSLGGEDGVIDQIEKTITIEEPLDAVQINSVPEITWTGAFIMPPETAAFNKDSATYTVYGANGATVTYTVAVTPALSEIDIGDTVLYPTVADIAEAILENQTLPVVGTRNIGATTLTLNLPSTQTVNWTASLTSSGNPTIDFTGAGILQINSGGSVTNTTSNMGRAIRNTSNGTVEVSGGTVTASGTNGYAIENTNTSTGMIRVLGGTVSSTRIGIQNAGTAAVGVYGGTVTASGNNGIAIINSNTGPIFIAQIDVSNPTLITSANTNRQSGTIQLSGYQANTNSRLFILGGTVENTSANTYAAAIFNNTNGAIELNGGTVSGAVRLDVIDIDISGEADIRPFIRIGSGWNNANSVPLDLYASVMVSAIGDIPGYYVNQTIFAAADGHTLTADNINSFTPVQFLAYSGAGQAIAPYVVLTSGDHIGKLIEGYLITGSGSSLTAVGGSLNPPETGNIQTVISAIRGDANGADVTITFGMGETLDIGNAGVEFNNSGSTWGNITLKGSITSANNDINQGTIFVNGPSIHSTADITNTFSGSNIGRAINNIGTSTVNISGGMVSAGTAVRNNGTGIINITDGMVSSTVSMGFAVYNNNTAGIINITGGTVSSISTAINNYGKVIITGGTVSGINNGRAIYSTSNSTVTISGTSTLITSSATSTTIQIDYMNSTLNVNSGTVQNIGSGQAITAAVGATVNINGQGSYNNGAPYPIVTPAYVP